MIARKILLVEDNPDDIELTQRAFLNKSIQEGLVIVNDGLSALEYLNRTGNYANLQDSNLPAVVLLDLNLPKMDGIEVLKSIRSNEKTKLLPVVILTSSNDDLDVIKSYTSGANSFVRKPVVFEEFIEAVSKLGLYWFFLNEAPVG